MRTIKGLPQIPLINGLRCEDHITFCVRYEDKAKFMNYWRKRANLKPMPTFITKRFPAEHIALVENPKNVALCEKMVGLSISKDPNSPLNKFIALYGGDHIEKGELVPGKIQHIAYELEIGIEMSFARKDLEKRGVKFMTPILHYKDDSGAFLKQMFVACEVPYGPFVEIIQRGKGVSEESFQGFNSNQIDNLIYYYDKYSKSLMKKIKI